jgi:predicted amidohydrolase
MSTLTITTIQANLVWEDKTANLKQLSDKIASINQPTEIVVLPEMFNTGFSMKPKLFAETMQGPTVNWMRATAMAKRVILTGSLMIEENGLYYNRLIWMLPNGELGYYDKRHRFAFAGEHEHYAPGNSRLIASVKGWKINLQICYDLRFPVWARQGELRQMADGEIAPEYDVLLYVANWPERRSSAWNALLQARAIENQCYVVAVNRVGEDGNQIYHSGDTQVLNPLGEKLYHCVHEEAVHTLTLNKEDLQAVRNKFPFWRDADPFKLL